MEKALFSTRYAGSVGFYAAMLHYGTVSFDSAEHYGKKNKMVNRMDIIGPNGVQTLSVPLVKNGAKTVSDLVISEHGNWRHNHWGALYSAYGRTPFFEFFADDLKAVILDVSLTNLFDFNIKLHSAIVDFLDLPIITEHFSADNDYVGYCRFDGVDEDIRKYYQIWNDKFGFTPNLSILDLLFNEGREAIFTLRKSFIPRK